MLAFWLDHVRRHWRGYLTLCAVLLLMLLPARHHSEPGPHLQDVLQRDFISVHTRNTPTTYYEGRQGPTGFEYELMRRFADYLGVSLALNDDHNTTDVLGAVRHQAIWRRRPAPRPGAGGVIFSRPIMPLQPLLVYRRDLPPPQDIEDLQAWRSVP